MNYFRNGFIRSFGRKSIHISDCHEHFLQHSVCASGGELSIVAAWRRRYSTPWIAPVSMHTSSFRAVGVRFFTCDLVSHIQQSRPFYESSRNVKTVKHFSTICFQCHTHQHLKLDERKFFPVISAHFCVHRWNSSSRPPSNPATSSSDRSSVLQHLEKFENSYRFHGYSTIRIGVGVFIATGNYTKQQLLSRKKSIS